MIILNFMNKIKKKKHVQFKKTHEEQEIEYTCFISLNFQVQLLHTHLMEQW